MENSKSNSNWVAVLIGGILITGLGIYSIFTPLISLITFGMILALILIYQGVAEIYLSFASRNHLHNWGWVFTYGIFNLLLGGYLLYSPGESALVITYVVLFSLMFRSFNAIGNSFDLKKIGDSGWFVVLTLGIIGVVVSFYLLEFPLLAAEFSLLWISSGLVVLGVIAMMYSLQLKQQ